MGLVEDHPKIALSVVVNVEVKAILPPMVSELRRLGFCAFGCVAFFWVATLGAEHKKAKLLFYAKALQQKASVEGFCVDDQISSCWQQYVERGHGVCLGDVEL